MSDSELKARIVVNLVVFILVTIGFVYALRLPWPWLVGGLGALGVLDLAYLIILMTVGARRDDST